jgi:C1A family cysteine protease
MACDADFILYLGWSGGNGVKVKTACFSIILMLVLNIGAFAADSNVELQKGGLNPEFVDYLSDINNSGAAVGISGDTIDRAKGLIPSPIKIARNQGTIGLFGDTSLPSSYDLRIMDRLTPVKDQGEIGSCWAFAAYSSLESFLLTNWQDTYDLSENNMITQHGFDPGPDDGGNRDMFTAYLARWTGPVSETEDPYPSYPIPSNIIKRDGLKPQLHVQDILFIPSRLGPTDNNLIKQSVMTYGAIDTSIYYNDSYYNASTSSFYVNTDSQPNHEITIVGWDDAYSRNNFGIVPPGDGAFICRNNWGMYWGNGGYFYVSYYDMVIGGENTAFLNAEPSNNYYNIYQHDPYGLTDTLGYNSNGAWFSSVFTSSGAKQETVAAASFYTTVMDTYYEVYVCRNYDINGFSSKELAATGRIDMPGYHTIKLDKHINVQKGGRFAVVVNVYTTNGYPAGGPYAIPVEAQYTGYTSRATASPDESYVSSNGIQWTDIAVSYDGSVCLKAFTALLADINGDKSVDIMDVAAEAQNYNMRSSDSTWAPANDLNGDNIIDIFDLVAISKDI